MPVTPRFNDAVQARRPKGLRRDNPTAKLRFHRDHGPLLSAPAFQLIGHGAYSLYEAYRLTGVPTKRIRRWTQGYAFNDRGQRKWSPPVVAAESQGLDASPILTFADLIEVRFLDAFRVHGVSWRAIRIASERAREILNHSHPFSSRKFSTDGRTILAEFVNETGDHLLIDLVRNQYEFRKIISPLLYAGIDFGHDDEPRRWWPLGKDHAVVIDPERSFGSPIVHPQGIATRVLALAAIAEDSIEVAADRYEVDPVAVAEAVEFELSRPR